LNYEKIGKERRNEKLAENETWTKVMISNIRDVK
jgi:hypothetical protein